MLLSRIELRSEAAVPPPSGPGWNQFTTFIESYGGGSPTLGTGGAISSTGRREKGKRFVFTRSPAANLTIRTASGNREQTLLPRFAAGDRLQFSSRQPDPSPGERERKGKASRRRHGCEKPAPGSRRWPRHDGGRSRQTECFRWLEGKASASGFGVQPGDVAVDAYRQRGSRGRREPLLCESRRSTFAGIDGDGAGAVRGRAGEGNRPGEGIRLRVDAR